MNGNNALLNGNNALLNGNNALLNGNNALLNGNNSMDNWNKALRLLIITILLTFITCTVSAQVSVTVHPKTQTEPLTLYPHELATYTIKVENIANKGVENLHLKISLDEGLVLWDNFTKLPSKVFTIPILEAFGKRELGFQLLLDLDFSQIPKEKKFLINVEYGTETFTNFSGTYLTAAKEPLLINASLLKPLVDPGKDNALEFDLLNQSNETITQINASLLLPLKVYAKGQEKITVSKLFPQEKLEDNSLEFSIDPLVEQNKLITLQVSYSDSNGFHTILKDSEMVVKSFLTLYYFAILIVIALIVFLFFKIKKKKKTETEKLKSAQAVEKVEAEEESSEEKTEE